MSRYFLDRDAWSRDGAWVGTERLERDEQFYIARHPSVFVKDYVGN
jgi:hypothetical protein